MMAQKSRVRHTTVQLTYDEFRADSYSKLLRKIDEKSIQL